MSISPKFNSFASTPDATADPHNDDLIFNSILTVIMNKWYIFKLENYVLSPTHSNMMPFQNSSCLGPHFVLTELPFDTIENNIGGTFYIF